MSNSIPTGWHDATLDEIADFSAGRTPSRARPEYWEGDASIPWVTIGDMRPHATVRETAERITPAAFADVFGGRCSPRGTLIMSFKLTIGRVATLGVGACHNEAIISIRPKGVHQDYLGYYLSQVNYADYQDRAIKGQTLNQDKLKRIRVLVPPLPEQQRIAATLRLVQRAIENEEKAIALTRELKNVSAECLFSRGLRGESLKETEIGSFPASWKLMRCEDATRSITVGVVVKPASHYVPAGVPAFRSFNVREDLLDARNLVFFAPSANNTVLSKSKLSAGDVLVVRTGYPGTSCVVPEEYDGANCIDLVIVRPDPERVLAEYLSRFFNSHLGRRQTTSSSHGLAQQHLNVGAVKRTWLALPTLDEQREIASALRAIDASLRAHERRLAVLRELFTTLLDKLMTGEIRVDKLKIDTSEVVSV